MAGKINDEQLYAVELLQQLKKESEILKNDLEIKLTNNINNNNNNNKNNKNKK